MAAFSSIIVSSFTATVGHLLLYNVSGLQVTICLTFARLTGTVFQITIYPAVRNYLLLKFPFDPTENA